MSFINICFINNGQPINMQATSDMMFAELAYKYFQKYGINQDTEQPKFIFNSKEISASSFKTLEELKIFNGSRIDVIIGNDVLGSNKY